MTAVSRTFKQATSLFFSSGDLEPPVSARAAVGASTVDSNSSHSPTNDVDCCGKKLAAWAFEENKRMSSPCCRYGRRFGSGTLGSAKQMLATCGEHNFHMSSDQTYVTATEVDNDAIFLLTL